jgi:hypothetical protein
MLKKASMPFFNVACPNLMKDTGRGFRGAPKIKHIKLCMILPSRPWLGLAGG